MNDALAHETLSGIAVLVDSWGELYDRRWGNLPPLYKEDPSLHGHVVAGRDDVRARIRLARDIISAMGEQQIAQRVVECEEGHMSARHPFTQARIAIIEAIAILAQREELVGIVGPAGPRLSASELHPTIWGAAAQLWDDGHRRAAVQTAATALEGLLQSIAGPTLSGEGLAMLFSLSEPAGDFPRLRICSVDPASKTWKSAHEGAAALVRGAFLAVRNLVSHPGWPEPDHGEALEMIAVLSYVARLVERSDRSPAP